MEVKHKRKTYLYGGKPAFDPEELAEGGFGIYKQKIYIRQVSRENCKAKKTPSWSQEDISLD